MDYDFLPDDMWIEIMKNMDTTTLFTMTKVNKRLRALANYIVTPEKRFRYNLQQTIPNYGMDKVAGTKAKKLYLLTDNEIRSLPMTLCRNPYYQGASPMRLYEHHILAQACMKKYVTWEYFCSRKDERDKRSQIQIQAIQHNRNVRREELINALAQYNIPLRGDSVMCHSYITNGYGVNGENIEYVVNIMREMEFLHHNTNYHELLNQIPYFIWGYEEQREIAKNNAVQAWWRKNRDNVDVETLPPLIRLRLCR